MIEAGLSLNSTNHLSGHETDHDDVVVLNPKDFADLKNFKRAYLGLSRPVLCVGTPADAQEIVQFVRDSDDVAILGEPADLTKWRIERIRKAVVRKLDPLTGVYKRSELVDRMTPLCAAASTQKPVSLILFDIDQFKTINDRFGHAVGDEILVGIGTLTKSHCRGTMVARSRGGEFGILVSGNEAKAKKVAAIVHAKVASNQWTSLPDNNIVTASFGVGGIVKECQPHTLLTLTDEALFSAKATGRNRVVCHSEITLISDRHDDDLAIVAMENRARVMSERVTSYIAQQSKRIVSSLRHEANTDPLTQLFNRRYLDRQLNADFQKAVSQNHDFCVALIDLDHFGLVNKDYGWPSGDKVLKDITKLIAGAVRGADWVGRYGGEEICLVMPKTDLESAVAVCERIRQSVETASLTNTSEEALSVTLSIGVAELDRSIDENSLQMIERISQLALLAKQKGRNQVSF